MPAEQAKALRLKTGWRHTASALLTGPVCPSRPLTRFVGRPKWPELAKSRHSIQPVRASGGAVAQLGERRNRTAEVRGSNPLGSTMTRLRHFSSAFATDQILAVNQ